MGERQGGHPTVATLSIGALAVEIRDIIAQSVDLGNAAPLAMHFAINPHCPLCYPNQQPILPRQTLSPAIRPNYTAVIWTDHDRWSGHGTVQALKTEEVDGKLKLFAILKSESGSHLLQPERPISVLLHRADRTIHRFGTYLPAGPRRHR